MGTGRDKAEEEEEGRKKEWHQQQQQHCPEVIIARALCSLTIHKYKRKQASKKARRWNFNDRAFAADCGGIASRYGW